jgi:tetratricopeptide (TPR) repeat protein
MKITARAMWTAAILLAITMGGAVVYGQAPSTPPATNPAPASVGADKDKAQTPVAPLTLDAAPPPVNAEEDAAIKVFRDAPATDLQKKLQLGDDFLKKYPQSRYRAEVYAFQVRGFMAIGQTDKMEAAGEKELELEPNDAQTMAIIGSSLPRSMPTNLTETEKIRLLTQSETYSRKALELLATLPKPPQISDEQFIQAKNQALAMAYGGLGLVSFRRGKFSDAIPNLEQSAKYDPNPDPVIYFVLGLSNEKASHFDDAVTAFTKCAAIQSSLQQTCKTGIDEAKKLGATQLSVPK